MPFVQFADAGNFRKGLEYLNDRYSLLGRPYFVYPGQDNLAERQSFQILPSGKSGLERLGITHRELQEQEIRRLLPPERASRLPPDDCTQIRLIDILLTPQDANFSISVEFKNFPDVYEVLQQYQRASNSISVSTQIKPVIYLPAGGSGVIHADVSSLKKNLGGRKPELGDSDLVTISITIDEIDSDSLVDRLGFPRGISGHLSRASFSYNWLI